MHRLIKIWINMKRGNVVNFTKFLANLKLNKFDKEIRSAIISNSIIANGVTKKFEESIQEARSRYFDGLEEEVSKLTEYRQRFETATDEEKVVINKELFENCKNALIAEKELIDFANNIANEEIDENFTKIDRDSFVDQCAEADIDITVNILELLNELFK